MVTTKEGHHSKKEVPSQLCKYVLVKWEERKPIKRHRGKYLLRTHEINGSIDFADITISKENNFTIMVHLIMTLNFSLKLQL